MAEQIFGDVPSTVQFADNLVLWNDDVMLFRLFDETLLPYFVATAQLLKGPMLLFYVISLTEDAFKFSQFIIINHLL